MYLLSHTCHLFKYLGMDIQCRFEGAVMDIIDFTRPAKPTRGEGTDDVPDLLASKASFERMLRFLEEKRAWPDDSLHLDGDEELDDWRHWPASIGDGAMVSSVAF
jgi:hypothetical protein